MRKCGTCFPKHVKQCMRASRLYPYRPPRQQVTTLLRDFIGKIVSVFVYHFLLKVVDTKGKLSFVIVNRLFGLPRMIVV